MNECGKTTPNREEWSEWMPATTIYGGKGFALVAVLPPMSLSWSQMDGKMTLLTHGVETYCNHAGAYLILAFE